MLLKELVPAVAGEYSNAAYSYNGHLINAINFTTRNASVSVGVKGDASLRMVFHSNCWDLGLGYNAYGHNADSICIKSSVPNCCGVAAINTATLYGAKGAQAANEVITDVIYPLNATATQTASAYSVGSIDNGVAGDGAVQYSAPAVLVSAANLSKKSGESPAQFTSKGFLTVAYNWADNQYTPYIAVVGEVEAGAKNVDLALWGVHLKGGMSY